MSNSDNENESTVAENVEARLYERAEQEVMSCLPELSQIELIAVCSEIGLTVPPSTPQTRKALYRLVLSYVLQREEDDADNGNRFFVILHGVLKELTKGRAPPQASSSQANSVTGSPVISSDSDDKYSFPAPVYPRYVNPRFSMAYSTVHNPGVPFPLPRSASSAARHSSSPSFGFGGLASTHSQQQNQQLQHSQLATQQQQPPPQQYPCLNTVRTSTQNKQPTTITTSYTQLKECKIRGKIGDPGEKDTLGYYGLLSEIKERELEGYKPERIVGAVINAVVPGNMFKRRLEMKRNLEGTIAMADLLEMLRTHYQERNSNSIMLDLQKAVQGQDETASGFCNRLIVLRDEVMSRSSEEGVPQNAQYLRKQFLSSFQTGLRNGNIRNDLRELLRSGTCSDNELLEEVTEAAKGEKERATKMAEVKRGVDVSLVAGGEKQDFQIGRHGTGLMAKIEELKLRQEKEIGTLRSELNEMKGIFKTGFANLSALSTPPVNQIQGGNSNAFLAQNLPASFAHQSLFPNVSAIANDSSISSIPFVPPSFVSNVAAVSNVNPPGYSCAPQAAAQTNVAPTTPANTSPVAQPYVIPMRRFSGCQSCVAAKNPRCTHCFFCEAGDHRMAACPRYHELMLRNGVVPNNPLNVPLGNGITQGSSPGNC